MAQIKRKIMNKKAGIKILGVALLVLISVLIFSANTLSDEVGNTTINNTNYTSNFNYSDFQIKLVNYNQDGYSYKSNNTGYNFFVKSASNWGDGTKFCSEGYCLIYQPQDLSYRNKDGSQDYISSLQYSLGTATNETISYQNVFQNVDLNYTLNYNSVKEIFIIKQKQKTPASYLGTNISLDIGGYIKYGELELWANGQKQTGSFKTNDKIEFKKNNKTIFYLPKPYAWDSAGTYQDLEYEVKNQGNQIWFYTRTPYSFLENAVYPVYIDPSSSLTTGIVAYYKMDEQDTSGTGIIIDSLGLKNGTNNGADNSTGKIKTAYDFESSNHDYINISEEIIGYSSFTISAWVKFESVSGFPVIYSERSPSNGNPILEFFLESSKLTLRLRNNAGAGIVTLYHSTTLSAGNWYFVVATYNNSNGAMKIYLNNGTPSSSTYSGGSFSNVSRASIGVQAYDFSSGFFDGIIDEIGIWNRALDSTEISELYNSGSGLAYPFEEEGEDITPPTFTTIPSSASINYSQTLGVDFDATDETSFGTFSVNDTSRFQINSTGWLSNKTVLGVGIYNLNISINDSSGNENSTSYQVTVNKATPALTLTATTPITYGTTSDFTGSGCPAELTCTLNNTNQVFGVGVVTFNYSTEGNANYTSNWTTNSITINQNTASCGINFNTTSPQTYPMTFKVWSNCTSAFTLYRNGTTISNNSEQSLNAGTWNFTVIRADQQNYSIVYDEELFTINKLKAVSITRLLPELTGGNFDVTQNNFFKVDLNVTCYSGDCGTINVSLDPNSYFKHVDYINHTANHSRDIRGITLYENYFYVTNYDDQRLYKYFKNGEYTGTSYDLNVVGNTAPDDLIFNGTYFYIVDSILDKIFKYDSEMNYVSNFSLNVLNSGPWGIWKNESFIYVDDYQDNAIYKYFENGTYIGVLFNLNLTVGGGNGDCRGFDVYDNSFWVTEEGLTKAGQIFKYDVSGNLLEYYNLTDSGASNCSNLTMPGGITFDQSDLWITDSKTGEICIYETESKIKLGLISTTAGAEPFYTNATSNPLTTSSLSEGQSETITFWVNATGDLATYEFYAYANLTSNLSISNISEKWNVTINAGCYEINTSKTDWSNISSCRINDTILQNRSWVQYDSCGLAENETFWETQEIVCDYCFPSRINTTGSDWVYTGDCQITDLRPKQRNLTEYDQNTCYLITGLESDISANITYSENANDSCDYCTPLATNTSWSEWQDTESCQINDFLTQNRSLVQYDLNTCNAITGLESDVFLNTTFWQEQESSCDYCSYNVANTSPTDWSNISSCRINDTVLQSRNFTQYDSNYSTCYAVTNISTDLWNSGQNETFIEYQEENCTYVDTTAPYFTNERNFTHYVNTSFLEIFSAIDDVNISTYWLNDTAIFEVNNSGYISNLVNLTNISLYWLNISVNDTSGNLNTTIFYINVTETPVEDEEQQGGGGGGSSIEEDEEPEIIEGNNSIVEQIKDIINSLSRGNETAISSDYKKIINSSKTFISKNRGWVIAVFIVLIVLIFSRKKKKKEAKK